MNIAELKQQGLSVSDIARRLDLDRKTVRKYVEQPPQPYQRQQPVPCKINPYRSYLRERWEQGVHNSRKLLHEIQERGYGGGYSRLKVAVGPWREQERERPPRYFATAPN